MALPDFRFLPFLDYAVVAGILFLGLLALLLVWHLTKAVLKTGLILSALALTAFAAWWLYNHFHPGLPPPPLP